MNAKVLVLACLAVTAGISSVRAEAIDMSTITCADMMNGNGDDAGNLLIWVDGWLAGQADETMLDAETLSAQVEGIVAVCEESPELSVINAAKQYLDQNN